MSNTIRGLSRFPCGVLLAQHRIEAVFLEEINKFPNVEIRHNVEPISVKMDSDHSQVPNPDAVTVTLRRARGGLSSEHPVTNGFDEAPTPRPHSAVDQSQVYNETIKAKYVIGCDGAHSWTRAQLGFFMDGEQTDYIWGVLDIVPLTDFRE
ncbi:MAG: hypothetical protein Q9177_004285 [Variospora cf. flavescens]